MQEECVAVWPDISADKVPTVHFIHAVFVKSIIM